MRSILHKRRRALLTGCTIVSATIGLLVALPAAQAGCNSGSVPNTDLLSNGNCQAAAPGVNAVGIGLNAIAAGTSSTVIGGGASASLAAHAGGNNAIAIGGADANFVSGASAGGPNAIAIGANSNANGPEAIAFGINTSPPT
jgi:hypothetical protein